jgi:hypothetical protein
MTSLKFPKGPSEQLKAHFGGVFWLGIAIHARSSFALLGQYILAFAVMDIINTYAMVP